MAEPAEHSDVPFCRALLVMFLLLLVPASAEAATVTADRRHLTVTAAASEANRLTVTPGSGTVQVLDPSAPLTPGVGCLNGGAGRVTCSVTSLVRVIADLGDADDTLVVTAPCRPRSVTAGPGHRHRRQRRRRVRGGRRHGRLHRRRGHRPDRLLRPQRRPSSADLSAASAEGDTFTTVEDITGGAGTDRLIGNTGANRLDGGDGDDLLDGAAGPTRSRAGAALTPPTTALAPRR